MLLRKPLSIPSITYPLQRAMLLPPSSPCPAIFFAYALFPSKRHAFCTLLHNRSSSQPTCSAFYGCCYIMMDFATAASLNGVCMCHRTLWFHDCSMTTDEIIKTPYAYAFCNFLKNIGFHAKGKLRGTKSVLQCSTFLCYDALVSWPSLFSIPHAPSRLLHALYCSAIYALLILHLLIHTLPSTLL